MYRQNPYSLVYETLSEVVTTRRQPHGGAARLYAASDRLRERGDAERALICGRASVAILRLEHAVRDNDRPKQQRMLEDIDAMFERWTEIPLAEAGILEPLPASA